MLQHISLPPPCAEQGKIHVLVREKIKMKNFKAYFSIKKKKKKTLHGPYIAILCFYAQS